MVQNETAAGIQEIDTSTTNNENESIDDLNDTFISVGERDSEWLPDEGDLSDINETLEQRQPSLRNTGKEKPKYTCYAFTAADPTTVGQAMNDRNASQWKQAMIEELDAQKENGTWELSKLPEGKTPVHLHLGF